MKIAMVSEHASPLATLGGVDAGGQNVYVDALSAAMAARGHEVTVYTRRDSVSLAQTVQMPGGYYVRHITAGPPTDIPKDEMWPHMDQFAAALAREWSHDRPDIAHAHFWMSGSATMDAAKQLGIPWAQTFHALGSVKKRHQGSNDTSPAVRISVESRICQQADVVIATCRDEVEELQLLGMDRERARIVPCGVDANFFEPAPPRASQRPHRILSLGRLVERKGIGDIVTALAELDDTELVIAGGPPADQLSLDTEVNRLQRIAKRVGCEDRIHFLGSVTRESISPLMAATDVFATAPWYEPFGIVPLEAMACARPVVGTAVGGLLDSVAHGVTGDLVPPRNPGALADAIRALLDAPERRTAYGNAGLARVRERFTWDRVAEQTEAVFNEFAALTTKVAP